MAQSQLNCFPKYTRVLRIVVLVNILRIVLIFAF